MARVVKGRNCFARPYWQLAKLLAACPSVRTLTGTANPTAAFARIHWPFADDRPVSDADPTPRDARPRLIVEKGSEFTIAKTGDGGLVQVRGTLNVTIEALLADDDGNWNPIFYKVGFDPDPWPTTAIGDVPEDDQLLAADNLFGAIIGEMIRRGNTSPGGSDVADDYSEQFLDVQRVREVLPTSLCDPTQFDGQYFAVGVYAVEFWG